MRIHQLEPMVANQIAAGEVIERPASVVKELLENALDAGATSIGLEIGFGGLNHIKISDNGVGIFAEDLPLAVSAHATSKIIELNDLYQIGTMGFRGEALASIAAVSRLSITSKPSEQAHAMLLNVEAGTVTLTPSARVTGTTIEVRDLFYNTPVRKKFLKTERTEYHAIEWLVKRFALSEPGIAITLTHNQKQMLVLPAATCSDTRLQRFQKIFGKTFIQHAIELEVERLNMRLTGYISQPQYQRSQNDRQWIYLNRRMVRDKLLQHAVKQAYESVVDLGRHPSCVLYLTIPPSEVDVNVHPTKHEVRFQEPRLVHDFIVSTLRQALDVRPTELFEFRHSSPQTIQEPQRLRSPLSLAQSASMQALSATYAMIFVNGTEPFLVNVPLLYHHQQRERCQNTPYPWSQRRLLVPVQLPLAKGTYERIESYQSVFEPLGLVFDFLDERTVIVRSIPEMLPMLELPQVFNHLSERVTLDAQAVLIASQHVDARQLSESDQAQLLDYFSSQHARLQQIKGLCSLLSEARCKALLS